MLYRHKQLNDYEEASSLGHLGNSILSPSPCPNNVTNTTPKTVSIRRLRCERIVGKLSTRAIESAPRSPDSTSNGRHVEGMECGRGKNRCDSCFRCARSSNLRATRSCSGMSV